MSTLLAPPSAPPIRLAYVTAGFPFGPGEAFLAPEARALAGLLPRLWLVPTRPRGPVVHEDARPLLGLTLREGLVPRGAVAAARQARLADLAPLGGSRSARILAKNAAVAPKALWLARLLDRLGVEHVHAHWGGTSSTMAMLAARQAGIPWSLTLHRWDIGEDNLLAEKVASASFVRAISEFGAAQVRERVPGARVGVLHMGVELPDEPAPPCSGEALLRLVAVGSLTPQKGQAALLDAMAASAAPVSLDLVGEGPLRRALTERVRALGLDRRVRLLGALPHATLLRRLRAGEWHAFVHSSPEGPGLSEGIPVSLMEAMAAGVPVAACASGGVAELVAGAGILVPRHDAAELGGAIALLAHDPELTARLGAAGRRRVRASFDAAVVAARLAALVAGARR